jgi:hypothetical protein
MLIVNPLDVGARLAQQVVQQKGLQVCCADSPRQAVDLYYQPLVVSCSKQNATAAASMRGIASTEWL